MNAAQLTEQQGRLLHHTLGMRPDQREGHRNYFLAGPGHHDMPDLEALEHLGLMTRSRAPKFCDPTDIVFRATEAGQAVALEMLPEPPPPAKLNQHHQWLDADTGFSFGEWLCRGRLPKFETRGYLGHGAGVEYRMYRMAYDGIHGRHCDVEGQWAPTKKDAKASYKAALKALQASKSNHPR
jgi:hypothetical protein